METTLLSSSSTGANGSTVAANGSASATSNMFTKLLVAQIQNQDPTSPTDPSTFVNQLAQLSQTEALQKVSDLTSANASILQSLQVLAMGAQVGSSVTATSDSVQLASEPVAGSFTLASASAKTNVVLTGGDGVKHTITLGAKGAGEVPFNIDPTALGLTPGRYSMAVETDTGTPPSIQIAGTLSSVKLSSAGAVTLIMSNLGAVAPSAVTSFNGVTPATPTTPN